MLNRRSSGPRRGSRTVGAVLSALGLLGLSLASAQPAAAATPLAPLDASTYTLTAGDFNGRWAAINALEATGRVTSFPDEPALSRVLDGNGHTGRAGLCHTSNLDPSYGANGFCWNTTDDTSDVWTPQGFTGSHDAQPGGTWNGKHVYIASWHNPDNTKARITVVDNSSPAGPPVYNHILLVDPYGSGTTANFRAVGDPTSGARPFPGAHADGISWYGNKLFVATGHQIQVYDLRHLWKMDNSSSAVGVVGGKAHAANQNWALPMIGIYSNAAAGAPCSDTSPATPCLTSLSLDRNGTDSLVTSEFAAKGGRPVVRWPLNATDGLLETDGANNYTGRVTANAAYRVPIWKVQGAATDGTYYYFSGECPEYAGTTDSDVPYCIHRAKPGEAPHVVTQAPPLTQNLSWAPSSGRLWGLNERANHTSGKRVVFSLDPPA
ncbi:hypothetical protein [Streptomyces zaomyceticus]|uniref:hypothetical protein n=1 Tax=Streptomyces zaomyceticus TaxID=68286 RepID=UPI0019B82B73|nr:hypothetical protein [Streptomyces zaomyceticus]GHG20680.1 hypothetical protein GCM10018791_39630 [Streptomyces zaomyceticus]